MRAMKVDDGTMGTRDERSDEAHWMPPAATAEAAFFIGPQMARISQIRKRDQIKNVDLLTSSSVKSVPSVAACFLRSLPLSAIVALVRFVPLIFSRCRSHPLGWSSQGKSNQSSLGQAIPNSAHSIQPQ